ncbi:exodeoxyribonuclease VII large subunit [Lewinella aquimaris]|uniref:Exodeoxyribonuclease 7 large subunit n=1 Tax=Neolewinella aquimaris TaxID=1835722 RepID=A0A840E3R3_9BACT|nr:exodeoxyribonuclease VII large subunit [Neolewinella aquimaris]MBB4077717.1 exodeoxyribonuclease VII large subunit [Neolewinella aquimaris]
MDTLPLSQLAAFIRRVFALNLPEAIWVSAELAQVSGSRGHTWLTLVEKAPDSGEITTQLDAVVWASALKKIRKEHTSRVIDGLLREGMSVRLKVTASFHERFGLKLIVEDVDPAHTIGSLEKARQATLEALSRDGILDRNASLPLPPVLQRLAVISSDTAAGLVDFDRQLRENPYGYVFHTDLYGAAMQGVQTGEEISSRLRQIARRRDEYDAIVIVRGGGGKTDLAAFDEEQLCRAVAAAPLPVLVGIGHEIDTTVLDRVVHRSLKTPTAVAAFLVDSLLRAEAGLLALGRSVATIVDHLGNQQANRLDRLQSGIHQTALASVSAAHLRAAAQEKQLNDAARRAVATTRLQLNHYDKLLEALHPTTTLNRGYALVSQAGRLIVDPAAVNTGPVEVRLRNGKVVLRKED